MKLYITLGQDHRHEIEGKVYDKDCIAVVNCKDYKEGRKLAFEYFGDKFGTSYTRDKIDLKFMLPFPRGQIILNPYTQPPISNCCFAEAGEFFDLEICPQCKDHCEWEYYDENEELCDEQGVLLDV